MTDSASDRGAQDRDHLTDGDITRAPKATQQGQCVKHLLHRDFETRGRAILRKVGAHKYAEDSTTEIICAGQPRGSEAAPSWRAAARRADAPQASLNETPPEPRPPRALLCWPRPL